MRSWFRGEGKKKGETPGELPSQEVRESKDISIQEKAPEKPSSQLPSQQAPEQTDIYVEVKSKLFGLKKEEYVGGRKLTGEFLADVQRLSLEYEEEELIGYLGAAREKYLQNKKYGELFTKLLFATVLRMGGIESYFSLKDYRRKIRVRSDVVEELAQKFYKDKEAKNVARKWVQCLYNWIINLYTIGDTYPGYGWSSFTWLVDYFSYLRKKNEEGSKEKRVSEEDKSAKRESEDFFRLAEELRLRERYEEVRKVLPMLERDVDNILDAVKKYKDKPDATVFVYLTTTGEDRFLNLGEAYRKLREKVNQLFTNYWLPYDEYSRLRTISEKLGKIGKELGYEIERKSSTQSYKRVSVMIIISFLLMFGFILSALQIKSSALFSLLLPPGSIILGICILLGLLLFLSIKRSKVLS